MKIGAVSTQSSLFRYWCTASMRDCRLGLLERASKGMASFSGLSSRSFVAPSKLALCGADSFFAFFIYYGISLRHRELL